MATWLDLLKLADQAVPAYRKAFLSAVANASRGVDIVALEAALKARNYGSVQTLVENAWTGVAGHWQQDLTKSTLDLLGDAGVLEATQLNLSSVVSAATTKAGLPTFRFDLLNPRAVDWAREHSSTLVTAITTEQRVAIRDIIARSTRGEFAVGTAARRIRDLPIGLDGPRAAALAHFDDRLAANVAKMSEKGASATALAKASAKREAAVARYRQRLLTARGQTIARTETMAAANQGTLEAWLQAQATGQLPRTAKKRWITVPDDRRCPICRAVHRQERDMALPFAVPKVGAIQRPPAHPNCRCVITLGSHTGKPVKGDLGRVLRRPKKLAIPPSWVISGVGDLLPPGFLAKDTDKIVGSFRSRSTAYHTFKKYPGSAIVKNPATGLYEVRVPLSAAGGGATTTTTVTTAMKTGADLGYTVAGDYTARSSAYHLMKRTPGSTLAKNSVTGRWEVRVATKGVTTTTTTTTVKTATDIIVKVPPGSSLMDSATSEANARASIKSFLTSAPGDRERWVLYFDSTPGVKKPWKIYLTPESEAEKLTRRSMKYLYDDKTAQTFAEGLRTAGHTNVVVTHNPRLGMWTVVSDARAATESEIVRIVEDLRRAHPERIYRVEFEKGQTLGWRIVDRPVPKAKVTGTYSAHAATHQMMAANDLADALAPGRVTVVIKKGSTKTADEVLALHRKDIAVLMKDPELVETCNQGGIRFVFSDGTVGDTIRPDLATVHPRGWPKHKTWKDVSACYDSGERTVLSGFGGGGSRGTVLGHETGHALDAISRGAASTSSSMHVPGHVAMNRRLADIWKRTISKNPLIEDYFKQEADDVAKGLIKAHVAAGLSESIAEAFSIYSTHGYDALVKYFGKEWAEEYVKCLQSMRELGKALAAKGVKTPLLPSFASGATTTPILAPALSDYTVVFEHRARSSAWRFWKKTPGSELTYNKSTLLWEVRVPNAALTTGGAGDEIVARYAVKTFAEKAAARPALLKTFPDKTFRVVYESDTETYLVVASKKTTTDAVLDTFADLRSTSVTTVSADAGTISSATRASDAGFEHVASYWDKTLADELVTRSIAESRFPGKRLVVELDDKGKWAVRAYDDLAREASTVTTTATSVDTSIGAHLNLHDVQRAAGSSDVSVMMYPSGDGQALFDWDANKWLTDADGKVLIVEPEPGYGARDWVVTKHVEPKAGLSTGHVSLPRHGAPVEVVDTLADLDVSTRAVESTGFVSEKSATEARDSIARVAPEHRVIVVEKRGPGSWDVVSYVKKTPTTVEASVEIDDLTRRMVDSFDDRMLAEARASAMRARKTRIGSKLIVRVEPDDTSTAIWHVVTYEPKAAGAITSPDAGYRVISAHKARSSAYHVSKRTPGSSIVKDKTSGLYEVRVATGDGSIVRPQIVTVVETKTPKLVTNPTRDAAWFDDLLSHQIGEQGGSNAGGLYRTASGESWYVKFYDDIEQARGEHLANSIYRQLGANAPESVLGRASNGKFAYASRWIEGATELGKIPNGLTEQVANQILDSFLTDVWVGNWDAVGSGLNNVVLFGDKLDQLARIDQGGTFFFRAKAGRKAISALDSITEWENFVMKNPDYATIFEKAGLSDANALGGKRLKAQLAELKRHFGTGEQRRAFIKRAFAGVDETTTVDNWVSRYDELLMKRLALIEERVNQVARVVKTPKIVTTAGTGVEADHLTAEQVARIVRDRTSPNQLSAERDLARWQRAQGISDAQRKKMEADLKTIIDKSSIVRNIESDDFEKVLKDGRFKSQFETRSSGGCLDPAYRSKVEHDMFAFPDDVHAMPHERPIYGTLQTTPDVNIRDVGYGDVRVRFKHALRARTTALSTDSLGSAGGDFYPGWVNSPSLRMLEDHSRNTLRRSGVPNSIEDLASSYFEIQIHGGVTVDDIAEVYFSYEPSDFVKRELARRHIPWKIATSASRRW